MTRILANLASLLGRATIYLMQVVFYLRRPSFSSNYYTWMEF